MANKKATVTKTATKKTSSRKAKAPAPITSAQAEAALDLNTMYVVSERKLLTWTPLMVFPSRDEASQYAAIQQDSAGVSFNKYKVDRVLFTTRAVHTIDNFTGI